MKRKKTFPFAQNISSSRWLARKQSTSQNYRGRRVVNYSRELILNESMNKIDIYSKSESEYLVNSTSCLPRIIKPRKRRKKERKSSNSVQIEEEDFSSSATFTFSLENEFTQSFSIDDWRDKTLNFNNVTSEENDLHFLNRLNESSSLVSLSKSDSNTSNSSSSSYCSCQLCAPNHKIWSFPLQKNNFQDNSITGDY